MNKKRILCLIICLSMLLSVSAVSYADTMIVNESFNSFAEGTFSTQVEKSQWATSANPKEHTVEIVENGNSNKALKITVKDDASSVVAVFKRGISISGNVLIREKIKVSDTNRRIIMRIKDDEKDGIYPVHMLNGKFVATNGSKDTNVGAYETGKEYTVELRIISDNNPATPDKFDFSVDGKDLCTDFAMPRSLNGNIKQIELCEVPSWAVNEATLIDDFYVANYTPVIKVLEEVTFTSAKDTLAVGESLKLNLSGKMSDKSDANLQKAQIEYSSDNKGVLTVDNSGTVKALSEGKATVTVKVKMDSAEFTKTLNFTVKYQSVYDIFSDDFESYKTGDFKQNHPEYYSIINTGDYFDVNVEEYEDSNKGLRIVMEDLTGEDTEFLTMKNAGLSISGLELKASFALELKLMMTSFGNSARSMPFMLYDKNGTRSTTFCFQNSKITAGGLVLKDGLAPNQWYNIKAVIYHDANVETKDTYDVYVDGELKASGLTMESDLDIINRITIDETTNYSQLSAYIDDFKITSIRFPEIEQCLTEENENVDGADGLSPDTEKINIKFSKHMNFEDFADNIALYEGDKQIQTRLSYNDDEKTLSVILLEKLKENTQYTLKVKKGIADTEELETYKDYIYNFKTGLPHFKTSLILTKDNVPVSYVSKGEYTAKFTLTNNTDTDSSAEIVYVFYDAKGRMTSYKTEKISIEKREQKTFDTALSADDASKMLAAYLFDSFDGLKSMAKGVYIGSDGFDSKINYDIEKLKIKVNDFDEAIEIYGKINDNGLKQMPVVIYSPSGKISGIYQSDAVSLKSFSLKLPFENNPVLNKDYTIKLGDGTTSSFVLLGKAYATELMRKINNAQADKIYDIICENIDYFEIDFSAGSDYSKLTNRAKTEIWNKVCETTIDTPTKLETIINELIATQIKIDEFWESFGKETVLKNAALILEQYAKYIGFDINNPWGYKLLNDKEKSSLAQGIKNTQFENTDKLKSYIEKNILLQLLNDKDWKTLEGVINNNQELIKVEFDSNYNGLTDINKADFMKELSEITYSDIDSFILQFIQRLSQIPDKYKNKKESSSGGGGGSSSGRDVTYQITEPAKQVNDNITDNVLYFTDVAKSHWAYDFINIMYAKKIISGYLDKTFRADDNITRAEFIKMVVEAFNMYDDTAKADFSDVCETDWFYKYAASAVNAKIITGYNDNSFKGNELLTRQDMAVIIYRAAGDRINAGRVIAFNDSESIADYALDAVNALSGAGIMNGMGDNMFMPYGYSTRAMVAKVIAMLIK